jgi:ABC-2 type transport system permease protein
MNRFPVAIRSLSELRWMIFWFGLGLGLYGAGMVWLFPAFEEYIGEAVANYPEEILRFFGEGDLAHPAGFMTLEYQSFAVLILMIFALVAATGQLAGDEGRGTLEGLLAQPVTRRRLILEKGAAVLAGWAVVCAMICVGWLLSVPFVDFGAELTLLDLVGATFGTLPVVALFGALGFLLGAVAPSRGAAAGILAGVAVVSYLAASLAMAIEPISWVRYLSPYYYSDASSFLTTGPVWWHQALLLLASTAVFALAVRAFERREIAAGSWQLRAAA